MQCVLRVAVCGSTEQTGHSVRALIKCTETHIFPCPDNAETAFCREIHRGTVVCVCVFFFHQVAATAKFGQVFEISTTTVIKVLVLNVAAFDVVCGLYCSFMFVCSTPVCSRSNVDDSTAIYVLWNQLWSSYSCSAVAAFASSSLR